MSSAPDKSKRRFVIYVKSWNYEEKVEVAKKNKNVMIAGEGRDFTIVTGSLGVFDGSPTFRSASLVTTLCFPTIFVVV